MKAEIGLAGLKALAMAAPVGVVITVLGSAMIMTLAGKLPNGEHTDVMLAGSFALVVAIGFEISLAVRFNRQARTLKGHRDALVQAHEVAMAALIKEHKMEYDRALSVADGVAAALEHHTRNIDAYMSRLAFVEKLAIEVSGEATELKKRVLAIEERWMRPGLAP